MEFPLSTAARDRSVQYLYEIFGSMGGVLKKGSGGIDINILSEMFKTFNTLVLGIAAIIIVYTTIKGVLVTAHEGEMMGKQGSGLWTPVKMVLGIAALVPTTGGYSAIQIIMMWIIVQGVAVADMVWGAALTHVDIGGSVAARFQIPEGETKTAFTSLFSGLVCHATFAETLPNVDSSGEGDYFCNKNPGNAACKPFVYDTQTNYYELGPGKACGALTVCNLNESCEGEKSSPLRCLVCTEQRKVLSTVLSPDSGTGLMVPAAILFEQTDYSYRNFYSNNDPSAGPGFSGDWIKNSALCQGKTNCCVPNTGSVFNGTKCEATTNIFENLKPNSQGGMSPPGLTVSTLYGPASIFPALNGGAADPSASIDFIASSIRLYQESLQIVVDKYIEDQKALKKASGFQEANTFSELLGVAEETGWIMAGAFYNIIARQNNDNFKAAVPDFKFESPSVSLMTPGPTNPFSSYRSNYISASALLTALAQQAKGAGGSGGSSGAGGSSDCNYGPEMCQEGGPSAAVGTAMADTSKAFTTGLEAGRDGTNPLVAMQQVGYALLFVAGILFVALIVATLLIGSLANLNAWVLGTGGALPTGVGILFMGMVFVPIVAALMGVLVLVGGAFGVYIPMIPYVIFTTGAIGWLLACIEAMVAGPLIALGILAPGGHHDILGKAEPALMLLFNIFLRPSLMIFGLIASMLLATVVILMINSGFGLLITSMGDLANTAATGGVDSPGIHAIEYDAAGNPYIPGGAVALAFNPVMLVLILILYVGIITTAMNKCFSAIHIIPERVMGWIGGQGANYGEGEAASAFKGSAEGAAQSTKGGMEAAKGGADKFSAAKGKLKNPPPPPPDLTE